MDDNELDRLFGSEFTSDDGAPEEKKAAEAVSDKVVAAPKKPSEKKEEGKVVAAPKKPSDKKEEGKVVAAPKKPSVKKEEGNPFVLKKEEITSEEFVDNLADDEPEEEEIPEEDIPEGSDEPEDAEKETEGSGDTDGEDGDGEEASDEEADAEEKTSEDAEEEKEEEPSEKAVRKAPGPKPVQKDKARRKPAKQETPKLSEIIPLNGKSIVVICLALAIVIMVVLVMFLPAFRVKNAHIEGNVVISEQQILREAGLEYDAHLMSGVSGNILDILRLDYGKTEERIKKENPYIEDIRITIKLPSTVDIKVKERSKVCYIKTPDGYAALDKDGIVLELSSFDSGKKVQPVICGLNIKYLELGKKVKISNMNDYKKSIIVLGAILAADNASIGDSYSMFENTAEVRVLPSGYIFLTVYSPSGYLMQVKLNSLDSISDDMAWLLYALNSDSVDKITVDGALDMTNDEFIFREY